ncbi:phBC6A51 family helix-turn-helix protein [Paenibacillus sp. Root444D2]|uniref:phBC6A51 family helix-turn-helix protein n=1 Tax=Paenibacillus sp. Root444D2 TaxID=1736538 RepID=UPI00070A2CF4|nr:phBC6A51 family helix-turn-helix protein [Paenibacillus sp. Root444D2]KQX45875.1 hypothetical protein ASD40_18745 [Paenibacillus sp. Root444D2]
MKIVRKGELTNEQLTAIEYLSMPRNGGRSLEEISAEIGISVRTLYDWRSSEVFAVEVRRRTMQRVAEHLPAVMDTLTRKAMEGSSIRAVETWLKAQGLLSAEMVIRPAALEDDRSNESIEAEIERLKIELGEIDNNEEEIDNEQD